jgi:osmotically-inducible protein OsmY
MSTCEEPKMTSHLRKLYALAPALFLIGAVSGCATLDKCDSESCRDDAKITQSVEKTLDRDPEVPLSEISVQTIDHVVYLNGLAEGFGSEDAESAAEKVPGVTGVVNSIVDDPE